MRRQWKLWQALRELLRIGHASSRDISVVVGHFTSLTMFGAERLSVCRAVKILQASHSFLDSACVRREHEWVWSCLPLMMSNLTVPWGNEAHAVDVSEWRRRGACYAPVARELIATSNVGRSKITARHQSRPVCKPPLLFSPDSQSMRQHWSPGKQIKARGLGTDQPRQLVTSGMRPPLQHQLWETGP